MDQSEQLTIKQTRTGYWIVVRGRVHVSSAMTRKGAEAERDLLSRLSRATKRRAGERAGVSAAS